MRNLTWLSHAGLNCWWDGHGAEEVDSPQGSSVAGVHRLEECQAACAARATCEAVIFSKTDSDCYRKRQVRTELCALDANFDLYVITM